MSTDTDTSPSGTVDSPGNSGWRHALACVPWRVYLLFAVVGSVMIATVAFSSYKFENVVGTHLPRADASMELRLDLATAHLWLEEILSGDRDQNLDLLWERLDRADAHARSMLAGGADGYWRVNAVQEPHRRKTVVEIREKIAQLRQMAKERIAAPERSGVGSSADQRFDAVFQEVQKLSHQVEHGVYQEVDGDLRTFGSTQTMLTMAVAVLVLIAGLAFNGFERRQATTLATVRTSAASLEKAIAERLKVEHSLRRTQYAIDHASDPIYWVMADASISYANEAACKALGYTYEELTSLHVPDVDPDFTWESWPTRWQDMKDAGSMSFESHHRTKDGRIAPMEVTTNYVHTATEEYIWAYVRDVSDRKQAQEALRQTEERFRGISSAASDAILLMDEHAVISFWNPAAEQMFGYSSDEAVGASFADLIVPQRFRGGFAKAFPHFLETGRSAVIGKLSEMTVLRREGPEFPVEVSVSRLRLGGRWHAAGIIRDVSERRRAARERARLAAAVEQAAESIVITDTEGTVQYVNPAFERLTGYSREEFIGKNQRILKSGKQDPSFYKGLWSEISQGRSWFGRFINKKKDGTLFEEEETISPVFNASGEIINFVVVKRDITHEVELESQLRQSRKMEAIGLLAGGVAHDFNNLLATINGYVALANSAVGENHKASELLAGIQRAVDQGEAVTQSLLTFSCGAPTRKKPVDLRDHAQQVVGLLDRIMPQGIRVSLESDDQDPIWINANDSQLQQVIMNLAINARDAMPDGGTLSVAVTRETAGGDDPHARVPMARLMVRDTGVGMTLEVRERIFEPFFTTKPKGRGTGLGLAIIHGIVKDHDGRIAVWSEPGCGTSFVVAFPLLADELVPDASAAAPGEAPGLGELVVLADNNPHVRGIMDAALKSLAFSVVPVSDGIALSDCAELHGGRIRLFVVDSELPRKSGFEFLKELRRQGRRTPVVLMVRGEDADMVDPSDGDTSVVMKPFAVSDFSTLVRGILSRQPQESGSQA